MFYCTSVRRLYLSSDTDSTLYARQLTNKQPLEYDFMDCCNWFIQEPGGCVCWILLRRKHTHTHIARPLILSQRANQISLDYELVVFAFFSGLSPKVSREY